MRNQVIKAEPFDYQQFIKNNQHPWYRKEDNVVTQRSEERNGRDSKRNTLEEGYSSRRESRIDQQYTAIRHNPKDLLKNNQVRQDNCSWKRIMLIILLIAILLAGVIFYIMKTKESAPPELNIQQGEPIIPNFNQISGLMTAPKLQPLHAEGKNVRYGHHRLDVS